MNQKKIMTSAVLSLTLLLTTPSAFATDNKNNFFIDEKGNMTPYSQEFEDSLDKTAILMAVEDGLSMESDVDCSIVRSTVDGGFEVSDDGGETWQPIADDGFYSNADGFEWKTVTIEDREADIARCKAEMEDEEFMKMMEELNDFTRQDMENLIKMYEQDIEAIKNGAEIQVGTSETGESMCMGTDPASIMTVTAVGAVFVDDETGKSIEYEAQTLEELKVKLEQAVKDGEITKEGMDDVIKDIEDGRNGPAEHYEVLPTACLDGGFEESGTASDVMKQYEVFGVTFESSHSYLGNIYYNGELVKSFTDKAPDGSTLFVSSKDGGEIALQTIYDDSGELVGVEKISVA